MSVKCLVCQKNFKTWVDDTEQKEKDASASVMSRLQQHLYANAVYKDHELTEAKCENMLKSVQVDVQAYEDEKLPEAKIIRKRRAVEQPRDSMEDLPPPLVAKPRWPSSSSNVPFVTGTEGMSSDKSDRARRFLSTLGTAELRDMVRLVMNEWQQRESRGI